MACDRLSDLCAGCGQCRARFLFERCVAAALVTPAAAALLVNRVLERIARRYQLNVHRAQVRVVREHHAVRRAQPCALRPRGLETEVPQVGDEARRDKNGQSAPQPLDKQRVGFRPARALERGARECPGASAQHAGVVLGGIVHPRKRAA